MLSEGFRVLHSTAWVESTKTLKSEQFEYKQNEYDVEYSIGKYNLHTSF